MITLEDRDLYQLLIAEFRYAIKRDNHLAPNGCVQHIMEYLPLMENQWKFHTAEQLTNEIIQERLFIGVHGRLQQDSEWEKLQLFLTNYLAKFPYMVEKYMKEIYNKSDWDANIDYYSPEILAKVSKNLE
jgi:hypothetical protein